MWKGRHKNHGLGGGEALFARALPPKMTRQNRDPASAFPSPPHLFMSGRAQPKTPLGGRSHLAIIFTDTTARSTVTSFEQHISEQMGRWLVDLGGGEIYGVITIFGAACHSIAGEEAVVKPHQEHDAAEERQQPLRRFICPAQPVAGSEMWDAIGFSGAADLQSKPFWHALGSVTDSSWELQPQSWELLQWRLSGIMFCSWS